MSMKVKVMMIAGDTFRAGAVPQLKEWSKRTNSIFVGRENADPASVIYDGLNTIKENVDIALIDTAGRLQNKINLMNWKINKVINKHIPMSCMNFTYMQQPVKMVSQAESFKEITV